MDEELISYTSNVTANNFSRTHNTQRDKANAIFPSGKLYKSDKLADTLKDLTIKNAKYYVSNLATMNDAKIDPKIVTHTSDGKGKFTDTSNRNI